MVLNGIKHFLGVQKLSEIHLQLHKDHQRSTLPRPRDVRTAWCSTISTSSKLAQEILLLNWLVPWGFFWDVYRKQISKTPNYLGGQSGLSGTIRFRGAVMLTVGIMLTLLTCIDELYPYEWCAEFTIYCNLHIPSYYSWHICLWYLLVCDFSQIYWLFGQLALTSSSL